MAKKKKVDLPSTSVDTVEKSEPNDLIKWVTVKIPIATHAQTGYQPIGVDTRFRSGIQRQMFKQALVGLETTGQKLKDGKAIRDNADVLKWITEEISRVMGG